MDEGGRGRDDADRDGATMHVEVLAPQVTRWSGRARAVVLPGSEGSLGVLPGRLPLVTALVRGEVRIRGVDGAWHAIGIGGGFATVTGDGVEVLDC